jgi:NADH dehydrogenase [ubiquinone] 1 alpha subcomplex assembly factor 7
MSGDTPLAADIRRKIATSGPMPVAQFMELALSHPEHGYYMRGDPIGRGGDFITAPEISQMFGELIGLWAAVVWRMTGAPASFRLIELGPGRGTLMLDALRASKAAADFRLALSVHLVETSPRLRERQRETLAGAGVPMTWYDHLADVPAGPAVVIANEFFDALPVNQAVKQGDGWHTRVVALDSDARLTFDLATEALPSFEQMGVAEAAPLGSIFEWRSDHIVSFMSRRVLRDGGAALVIDYGHTRSDIGDTLQAMRGHAYANPLAAPGLADLTAHVDFAALARAAEQSGARTHGPIEQVTFLRRMGIDVRAAALKAARPDLAATIDAAVLRLTAGGATGMGTMFKVMAISQPRLRELPGFDDASGKADDQR